MTEGGSIITFWENRSSLQKYLGKILSFKVKKL